MNMVKVKINKSLETKEFFLHHCTGYGYVNKTELLNETTNLVRVQCEDNKLGKRACIIYKNYIEKDLEDKYKYY
ncbi:hypothetical protein [uncultured Clostridium sp.]|uniref:hypothetical protein n=1 Tax=uncultured Clostridium sp. TaxID=59620 RepID=UPI0026F400CD|nr:hypothetical protein [uncultured Clostridium sp.]